jgi:hypothetical protein
MSMATSFIDLCAGVDFPAPEPAVTPQPRGLCRFDAIYELRELTGVLAEQIKRLPQELLQQFDEEGADAPACVLAYYVPDWRGAPFQRETYTYQVDGVSVFIGHWRYLRALLNGDLAAFYEMFVEQLARARVAVASEAVTDLRFIPRY